MSPALKKTSPRLAAYADVDEANSTIGVAIAIVLWIVLGIGYFFTPLLATLLFALPLYTTRMAAKRFVEMRDMFTQTITDRFPIIEKYIRGVDVMDLGCVDTRAAGEVLDAVEAVPGRAARLDRLAEHPLLDAEAGGDLGGLGLGVVVEGGLNDFGAGSLNGRSAAGFGMSLRQISSASCSTQPGCG